MHAHRSDLALHTGSISTPPWIAWKSPLSPDHLHPISPVPMSGAHAGVEEDFLYRDRTRCTRTPPKKKEQPVCTVQSASLADGNESSSIPACGGGPPGSSHAFWTPSANWHHCHVNEFKRLLTMLSWAAVRRVVWVPEQRGRLAPEANDRGKGAAGIAGGAS